MLCRKGWKAVVVVFVVAAGLSFRADADLYSDFAVEPSVPPALELTLQVPDFALLNYHAAPHYLNSNSLPDLLSDLPPQDLFTYRSTPEFNAGMTAADGTDDSAWETLWNGAHRIPIHAVPEPSKLALLAAAALLLGARHLRPRK